MRARPFESRPSRLGRVAVVIVVVLASVVALAAPSRAAGGVYLYTVPSGRELAADPIKGPDGNLWFISGSATPCQFCSGQTVSSRAADGTVSDHPAPSTVTRLALDAGNRVWFTEFTGTSMGYLTPENNSYVSWPELISSVATITLGPDGNMWYYSFTSDQIVRVTPAGVQTAFTIPQLGPNGSHGASGMASGADGMLWITNDATPGSILRVDPTTGTVVSQFPVAGAGIVLGPDGNYWFGASAPSGPAIGRITPAGTATTFTAGVTGDVQHLVTGPDGNLWFSYAELPPGGGPIVAGGVGRITTTGTVTEFPLPDSQPGPIATLGDKMYYEQYFNSTASYSGDFGIIAFAPPPTTTTTTTTSTTTTIEPSPCGQPTCPPDPIETAPAFTG